MKTFSLCVNGASTTRLLYFLWWKKMCKTSTQVLNINFSESQPGVKGRKLRVSIQLTMRRWAVIDTHTSRHIEGAVTSSSPPPLSAARHLSLTPAARVQAAQLQEIQLTTTQLHSTPLQLSQWPRRHEWGKVRARDKTLKPTAAPEEQESTRKQPRQSLRSCSWGLKRLGHSTWQTS